MASSDILSSAIGASASHINTFLGFLSNNRTNNTNRDIAREANEWNYRMFQEGNSFNREERLANQAWNEYMFNKQMGYNTSERLAAQDYNTREREASQAWNQQMWNAQNAYNSPAAQAERMRQAGLNPSLAGINSSSGNAASIQSAPASSSPASASPGSSSPASSVTPPTAVVPNMIPEYNPSWMNESISSMIGALASLESIKGQAIDNETKGARNKATLDNMLQDLVNKRAQHGLSQKEMVILDRQIRGLELANEFQEKTNNRFNTLANQADEMFSRDLVLKDQQYQMNELEMASKQLMNRLAVAANSRESALAAATIKQIQATTENLIKEGKLITVKTVKERLTNEGLRLDNLEKRLKVPQLMLDTDRNSSITKTRSNDKGFKTLDNVIWYLTGSFGNVFSKFSVK